MKSFLLFLLPLLVFSHQANCQQNHDIVRNKDHIITYECTDETIKFTFDLIGDVTNELDGKWPILDHIRIWVDFNQNAEIDELIDRSFTPFDSPNVCKSLMYTKTRLTTCFFDSGSSSKKSFTGTSNLGTNHIVFEMEIPKANCRM